MNFTPKERRALIILLLVLLASALVQWLLPGRMLTGGYDYTLEDSLFAELAADTLQAVKENITQTKQKIYVPSPPSKKTKTSSLPALKSININSAARAQLVRLPGIGPKTAQAIIAFRTANGPFQKVEELTKVKRIGPKTLEKIRPYIVL